MLLACLEFLLRSVHKLMFKNNFAKFWSHVVFVRCRRTYALNNFNNFPYSAPFNWI